MSACVCVFLCACACMCACLCVCMFVCVCTCILFLILDRFSELVIDMHASQDISAAATIYLFFSVL